MAKVTTASICLIISQCQHIDALDVVCFAIKHIENDCRKRVGEFVNQPANLTYREMLAVKQRSRFWQNWTPIERKSLYGPSKRNGYLRRNRFCRRLNHF